MSNKCWKTQHLEAVGHWEETWSQQRDEMKNRKSVSHAFFLCRFLMIFFATTLGNVSCLRFSNSLLFVSSALRKFQLGVSERISKKVSNDFNELMRQIALYASLQYVATVIATFKNMMLIKKKPHNCNNNVDFFSSNMKPRRSLVTKGSLILTKRMF